MAGINQFSQRLYIYQTIKRSQGTIASFITASQIIGEKYKKY